jgi:ubiquinone/menaquinone biosynthesis C-methylase UbiE
MPGESNNMGWFGWSRRPPGDATAQAALDLNALSGDVSTLHALDVWHYAVCHAFGTLASAPVAPSAHVLDVASGTGRWAREMARLLPGGWVAGFDLDGQQIDRALDEGAWRGDDLLPPNCQLVQADALDRFPYADASFDYTHGRFFSAFVPVAQWPRVIGEMVRVTRPSGWVELVDATRFTAQAPAHDYLLQCLRRLYEHDGLTLEPGSMLERLLREAGLQHLTRRTVTVQAVVGREGLGTSLVADLVIGLITAGPAYVQAGIASEDKVRSAIERARRDETGAAIQIALTGAWGQRL